MEVINRVITQSLPNYLANLPVPKSFIGFARMTVSEWVSLMPFVGAVSLIVYVSVQAFKGKPPEKKTPVNLKVMKETGKVVNMVDIEDLGDKVSYCRCWRSKKFPLCDGSHNKHNEETGDNVGPLVLKRREATN
ncbi:hypothetical protein FSP39_016811 [Pinctada imbricata]|uniref:CDGSH iron-sulfur domain-containing protein 2 homologue n=1 Tax=Pinctada imbricata TaxID=66713 RepID=A0AA88XSW9_PINIB|nr:hypothetical protein FSP39_016811 [Pinctada imbricata]